MSDNKTASPPDAHPPPLLSLPQCGRRDDGDLRAVRVQELQVRLGYARERGQLRGSDSGTRPLRLGDLAHGRGSGGGVCRVHGRRRQHRQGLMTLSVALGRVLRADRRHGRPVGDEQGHRADHPGQDDDRQRDNGAGDLAPHGEAAAMLAHWCRVKASRSSGSLKPAWLCVAFVTLMRSDDVSTWKSLTFKLSAPIYHHE
jgi:hypothetical protein